MQMHCICRSDEHSQQVGCTILVGRMHNFCRIRHTKVVHPTYKSMCIRHTNLCATVTARFLQQHRQLPTDKICSSCVGRITKQNVHPTYSCRRSEVSQDESMVGRKYCGTEVLWDGSNITNIFVKPLQQYLKRAITKKSDVQRNRVFTTNLKLSNPYLFEN